MADGKDGVQIIINGEKYLDSQVKFPVNGIKDVDFLRLWDTYRGLLTKTQREISDLHFNCDLSLSEIAEQKNISRQAVSDCLKACKKQLEEFDRKLKFTRVVDELCLENSFVATNVKRWAEEFCKNHPEYGSEMQRLKKILEKDYSEEIERALNKNN